MRAFHPTLTMLIGLSLGACASDGKSSSTQPEQPPAAEAPASEEPVATPANSPVPLIAWVDDIIEHRSTEEALPDTVEDKNVADSDDPTLFDKYLD